jgi:serine O-acetyltransferase
MEAPGNSPFSARVALTEDLRRYKSLTGAAGDRIGPLDWLKLLAPRLLPNLMIRLAHRFALWNLRPLARLCSLTIYVLFGIEVAIDCRIGPGLFLPHTQGTVIGAESIGRNCTIYQGVTLGARELDMDFSAGCRPVVGDDVLIGSGAKVLGPIVIGDGVKIGSNANVVQSLPPGVLALAPPAQVRTTVDRA